MPTDQTDGPDRTAERVALWRAMHVQIDAPPHVLSDEVGLQLVAPDDSWRQRPDMDPQMTRLFRASIIARARFIEDLVEQQVELGVRQYVLLGAGLDTFAQRKPQMASRLKLFEVDRPAAQQWKRRRLMELGYGVPDWLQLVKVEFEAGDRWWDRLSECGFDPAKQTIVASTGVSMYLTRDANAATLRQVATLAPRSIFVMSFLLPIEMSEPAVRTGLEFAERGARVSGTPFISYFVPEQLLSLARECGFRTAQHISAETLTAMYFANRTDGLRPPFNAEELLVATT